MILAFALAVIGAVMLGIVALVERRRVVAPERNDALEADDGLAATLRRAFGVALAGLAFVVVLPLYALFLMLSLASRTLSRSRREAARRLHEVLDEHPRGGRHVHP